MLFLCNTATTQRKGYCLIQLLLSQINIVAQAKSIYEKPYQLNLEMLEIKTINYLLTAVVWKN
jgi:hypothetical protein